MKYLLTLVFLSVLLITSCQKEKIVKEDIKNLNDSLSYIAGNEIGKRYKAAGYEINPDILKQGFVDGMQDTSIFSQQDEIAIRASIRREKEKELAAKSEKNIEEGKMFLEKIKLQDSVMVGDSGMVYKILQNRDAGRHPKMTDNVSMLLEVKSIDGKVLFSNFNKQPIEKEVETNILGIQLALKKMRPGSVWELYLSPELAYGPKGYNNGYQTFVEPNQYLQLKLALIQILPSKKK